MHPHAFAVHGLLLTRKHPRQLEDPFKAAFLVDPSQEQLDDAKASSAALSEVWDTRERQAKGKPLPLGSISGHDFWSPRLSFCHF